MHRSLRGIVRSLRGAIDLPCMIVAAHPDDETLGASSLLQRSARCNLVHLTDGAPRDPVLRGCAAGTSRFAYANARRGELLAALGQAKVASRQVTWLGAVDQEASFALSGLVRRLHGLLIEQSPVFVVTHAYEGGHPDHDAAAFVTRAAVELCAIFRGTAPVLLEMASYHGARGALAAGEFVPGSGSAGIALRLSPREVACKQRMLACFASQARVIAQLARPLAYERFRLAPHYDFSRAPHAGPLHYERLGWRLTGERFRELARGALREFVPEDVGCRYAS
jgi:LmbE family N-acetylglucosaminyl deacetylase